MAMDIAKQFQASVTGNIESALLVIHDYRQTAQGMRGATQKEQLAAIRNMRIADTRAALSQGTAPPTYTGSLEKLYRVQFNPSQLKLNVSTTPRDMKDLTSNKNRSLAEDDAKLFLTTTLYFDSMRVYDAFAWEKYTAGLTAQGVANLANFVKEGKGTVWSVQDEVEGLLSALHNPYTRYVSFRWADFSFAGQLNTIRANYTMFSPAGRPVRAQVQLRLQHEMDPNMLHQWYADFDSAFSGVSSNLVRPEQNYGSLLNLGL